MKKILDSITAAGGNLGLKRLVVQGCSITLATDSLHALENFTELTALDLSLNDITVSVINQLMQYVRAIYIYIYTYFDDMIMYIIMMF